MAKQFDPRFAVSVPRFMGRPLYPSPNFVAFLPTLGPLGERFSTSYSSIPVPGVPGGDTHLHPHREGLDVTTRLKGCGSIHDKFDQKGNFKDSVNKFGKNK